MYGITDCAKMLWGMSEKRIAALGREIHTFKDAQGSMRVEMMCNGEDVLLTLRHTELGYKDYLHVDIRKTLQNILEHRRIMHPETKVYLPFHRMYGYNKLALRDAVKADDYCFLYKRNSGVLYLYLFFENKQDKCMDVWSVVMTMYEKPHEGANMAQVLYTLVLRTSRDWSRLVSEGIAVRDVGKLNRKGIADIPECEEVAV